MGIQEQKEMQKKNEETQNPKTPKPQREKLY
jgi:hypothetical protein